MQQAREGVSSIDLAHSPALRVGDIIVEPALRTVRHGDRRITLEPRVMQVLVALARAEGGILSRDDLIASCWGGRIVGENAIARAISQLRRLGPDLGTDALRIETIAKVGYRLVADETIEPVVAQEKPDKDAADDVNRPPPRGLNRRGALVGGAMALAGLGGAGWWVWRPIERHRPHPEALAMYERAVAAQREWDSAQTRQSVSFLERAVALDPLFADAWGALALGYFELFEATGNALREGLPQQVEAAARRALELDSDNPDAQLARLLIRPVLRRWRPTEAELLRLAARFPDHALMQGALGGLQCAVGRWRDGLVWLDRQLAIEPYVVGTHFARARALWALGRVREAEQVLDAAIARWSGQAPVWILKFNILLFGGRPAEAAAFAADPRMRPDNMRPNGVAARLALARAVQHGGRTDVDATLADLRTLDAAGIDSVAFTAPIYLILGHRDEAVRGLERYFFGGPAAGELPAVPAPSGYDRRATSFLFLPNMQPLWRDPWFAGLLRRIGLEDYWSRSRTRPDYRTGG